MKIPWFAVVLLASTVIGTQAQVASATAPAVVKPSGLPAPTPYAVVSRDAHSRVWERTAYELGPSGQAIPRKKHYTELATGLHYWANGQWVESKEEIDILPGGGAVATKGQHQAYFPGDIYQGDIELVTPDGKQLRSRPVGLSYDDGTNTVLIAVLTNSVGQLAGPNQVVYPDTFTGLKADLRYTYTKGAFEQDVVLREQPLTPESYGLNPATTRLQVLTEFFNPPPPVVSTTALPEETGTTLTDENLDFGIMKMTAGKAFLLGSDAHEGGVAVCKSWVVLAGRQFLVEEVPVEKLVNELLQLPVPQTASIKPGGNSVLHVVSAKRLLPAQRLAETVPGIQPMQMARAAAPSRGLVLDYTTLNSSQTNYTFQGDTTYYISGTVNLYGTNSFEGGTVIKYATNASIALQSTNLNWRASAYWPVVFTAQDDNSVGQQFGSGNPSGYYANPALSLISGIFPTLSNFRIAYARQALVTGGGSYTFYDCQFVNCQNGSTFLGAGNSYYNALFSKVMTNFNNVSYCGIYLQNVTVDSSAVLAAMGHGSVTMTNCILANVTNLGYSISGSSNGFYRCPMFGTGVSNTFYPFQTVGAGSYYLANGCSFTNAGTTNIDSTLLADLRKKTTYPPIAYSNVPFSISTNFSPQVQRDTDTPDLGYHYDPIDYFFGGVVANSNITFTAGTAVGWFYNWSGDGYGITLGDSVTAAFNGTVTAPCVFARYNTVQEGGNGNWMSQGSLAGITGQSYVNAAPTVTGQFTHSSMLNNEGPIFRDNPAHSLLNERFTDCDFWSSGIGGYYSSVNCTNCFFFRSGAGLWWNYGDANMTMWNCTLIGGNLTADHTTGSFWPVTLVNCAFDGTTIYMNAYNNGTTGAYCDYNAFLANSNLTTVMGGHELTNLTSYNWQSSWLGNYYLPPNSSLINTGSITANLLGLYHFTTQTNQVKETNSVVDIGYHYVAVGANGFPLDSNGDEIPDYLEDANGNGLVDNGESPWMPPPTITVQPANQTVNLNSNASFGVTAASLVPMSYQWLFNGTNIIGATNTTLTLTNVQPNEVGSYAVVVTNPAGSVTSSSATLTVNNVPFTNLPYGSSGYRYLIVTTNQFTTNYTNFYTTNFVDTNFINGQAAFGSTDHPCGGVDDLYTNYNTYWTYNTDLLLRRHFYVPPAATNLTLGLAIDNDAQIYINGILITNAANVLTNGVLTTNAFNTGGWFVHEGYASDDSLLLEGISNSVWHAGTNLLAVHGRDRGCLTYADVQISCLQTYATTNQPPTVQITSPVNQTFLAHTDIPVQAIASDPAGTISWVQFFVRTNSGTNVILDLGVFTNGNYQVTWLTAFGGTFILTAEVMDSRGLIAWSAPVTNIVRNLPAVTITNPTNHQLFLMFPTNLTIQANAIPDPSTIITNVTFYQGTNYLPANIIGVSTSGVSNVFSIIWSNVFYGTNILSAEAFDTNGGIRLSAPITITVETNQPPSVYAGPNQTIILSTNALQLTGLVSDDGLPYGTLSVNWTNVSGPTNVVFSATTQQVTYVYFSATGVYQLRLSASDGQYTTYSTVTNTVLPADLAPVVSAGTNQTIVLAAQYAFSNGVVNSTTSKNIIGSRGKEFWLGFPQNFTGANDINAGNSKSNLGTNAGGQTYLTLSISSETNTFVCVMIPGIGFFTNCSVAAGVTTSMYLPVSAEVDTDDLVEGKGIHVVAQDEISVYGLSHKAFTSDAYCGLPIGSLGTNYIIAGWESADFCAPGFDSEFLIVGSAKGTTVKITPTATDDSGSHQGGDTFEINLDEGQTYQLQSTGNNDLAGTIITANKPIAVFSGEEAAYVPYVSSGWANILLEQIPPTSAWGREFITAPLALRVKGDQFEVVATTNLTTVWTNGTIMTTNLAQGQGNIHNVIYKFQLAGPCKITADKPILLVQFANSSTFSGQPGDPFMMVIPPFEQFLTTYTVSTPLIPLETNCDGTIAVWTNFVNIVVTNAGTNSISLDGGVVNSTNFFIIGTNGFSYAQVPLIPGSHHLNCSVPFGVFMYGLASNDDAYGYPGGYSQGAVADVALISLNPKAATNKVGATGCLTACVTNQNSQPVAGVRVDFQIAGSNSLVGSAYSDENGQARFCYTGINPGVDTIGASVGTNTDVATITWTQPFFVLQGSVSDDGLPIGITNILWTQAGGPPVAGISSSNIINPVVQVTGPGFYSFQLSVDDTELTNSAQVGITVSRNQPPSVDAGTNQFTRSPSVVLNGRVTDDGLPNNMLTTTWSMVSGPGTVTFGNANQAVTTATFSGPGVYVLKLTGDDSQAAVYSCVTITVQVNPQPVQCGVSLNGNLVATDIHSIGLTNNYADYYQFTGQSNQFLVVTMTSTNFDTYLIIRNQQLQLLAEDDDCFDTTLGGTNSRIVYCLPTDGAYIIEATSAFGAQTGSYAIQFECGLPQVVPPQQITIISPPNGFIFPIAGTNITVAAFTSFTNLDYYTDVYDFLLYTNGCNFDHFIFDKNSIYGKTIPFIVTYPWSNVPAGNYTLTAITYVNYYGSLTSITSAPVVISVGMPR
jgi:hypothetical protein